MMMKTLATVQRQRTENAQNVLRLTEKSGSANADHCFKVMADWRWCGSGGGNGGNGK